MVRLDQFFNFKNIVIALIGGVIVSTLTVGDAYAEDRKRIYSSTAIKARPVKNANWQSLKFKVELKKDNKTAGSVVYKLR